MLTITNPDALWTLAAIVLVIAGMIYTHRKES